jgi:hypothetical protein
MLRCSIDWGTRSGMNLVIAEFEADISAEVSELHKKRRCKTPGCARQSSYGKAGRKRRSCAAHKRPGDVSYTSWRGRPVSAVSAVSPSSTSFAAGRKRRREEPDDGGPPRKRRRRE